MKKSNEGIYDIYQIKHGSTFRDYGFENMERLDARGLKAEYKNYDFVYSGKLKAGMHLEDIFTKFNLERPQDFKGHSLSVSDVIVLEQNGKTTAHFVDSFGFKEIPDFVRDREEARNARTSVMSALRDNRVSTEKETTRSPKQKQTVMDDR